MIISLVVAHGRRREIGLKGKLPWHMKSDLMRFKKLTWGGPVVMGRKTYESLGRPLPGRLNLVVSREKGPHDFKGATTFAHVKSALNYAQENNFSECFVIGGTQIFEAAWEMAQKMYITEVDYCGPADTFFPPYVHLPWHSVHEQKLAKKKGDDYSSVYKIWEKIF